MTLDDEMAKRLVDVLERIDRRLAEANTELLSVEQACEFIGIGRTKLFDLIREGKLRKVKQGKDTFVTVDSARALIGVRARSAR